MLKTLHLDHQFVRHLPDALHPGILYISMEYATASHLCCCGCGEEVVTPFAPAQWKMTFDGDAVSLHPSVGNWLLACRSHYVVRQGRVIESEPWSEAKVAAGLARDKVARTQMFAPKAAPAVPTAPTQPPTQPEAAPVKMGFWTQLIAWVAGK